MTHSVCYSALLFTALAATAAQPPRQGAGSTQQSVPDCSSCHSCARPVPGELCLLACIRSMADKETIGPPDLIILDELMDLYLPVPFDHKGHADMAEMTHGCTVCHHHTPAGAGYSSCKSCHEVSSNREDIRKPGLKGAYHRQCLSCHREWSHETACEVCHAPRAGRTGAEVHRATPTKDDIMGMMHPPIPEPETKTYQTKYQYVPGTNVLFRHKQHIHRFGFRCVECHHEDSCLRCHEAGRPHEERRKSLEDHHKPCARCHDTEQVESCDRCHWSEDGTAPDPFDHAATGWPLGRYHESAGCRACHTDVPFVALDRSCNSCHSDWAPGTFSHAITGQELDDTHAEFDCKDCHADGRYEVPPACDACHEEDEGISYPDRLPGPKNSKVNSDSASR